MISPASRLFDSSPLMSHEVDEMKDIYTELSFCFFLFRQNLFPIMLEDELNVFVSTKNQFKNLLISSIDSDENTSSHYREIRQHATAYKSCLNEISKSVDLNLGIYLDQRQIFLRSLN